MWKLIIEDDEGKRHVVPLGRDEYGVGRQDGNAIRLTERNVSRRHARLRRKNGPGSGFLIEDQQSYNGVFVNGLRLGQPQELGHGDLVQIGDYRLFYQDDAVPEAGAPGTDPEEALKHTVPMAPAVRGTMLLERPNRLVMLVGPTPGVEFPLDRERLTVGRAEDATISINHNSVSRGHCEIHALGDGRFEIVDLGSSNGVRVNGSDLRRGIIEVGDLIELGDVRFKFVGAGQVFVAGPGESQQLTAIRDRDGSSSGRGSWGVVPSMLLGVLVAFVAVGAFWWFQLRQREAPLLAPGTATAAGPSAEQLVLDAAKAACSPSDCEASHVRITSEIPETSPLRASADFLAIEATWADNVLGQAGQEPDPQRQHELLRRVADAPAVDAERRRIAAQRAQALTLPAPVPTGAATHAPEVTAPATAHATPSAPPTPAPRPERPRNTSSTSATTASPAPTPRPTATSPNQDADKARALMATGDNAGARRLLETKVMSGKGSAEEVFLLRQICKSPVDMACLDAIKQRYPH